MKKRVLFLTALAMLAAAAALMARDSGEVGWTIRYLSSRSSVRSVKPLAPLPDCKGCNLVLVSLDTLRADVLGFQGSAKGLSPNLDRIAAKSIVFESTWSNAWFTTPSHMTVFTSLYPSTHRVQSQRIRFRKDSDEVTSDKPEILSTKYRTLAEILAENGYRTYWYGPLKSKYLNFSHGFGRGFQERHDSAFFRGLELERGAKTGFDATSLEPLRRSEKPAFLFLHSYITHSPYILRGHAEEQDAILVSYTTRMLKEFAERVKVSPSVVAGQADPDQLGGADVSTIANACTRFDAMGGCFELLGKDPFWHGVGQWQMVRAFNVFRSLSGGKLEEELVVFRHAYEDNVRELDRQVGQLWSELEASGELEKSVVVFFSDHGDELFGHRGTNHSNFHEHTSRVPFLIYHPKVKEGIRAGQLMSLVDLMPTVLGVLGIAAPAQSQGKAAWSQASELVYGYTLGMSFVRDREWKLMRDRDGSEQLFHLPTDPGEQANLVASRNPIVLKAYQRLSHARKSWKRDKGSRILADISKSATFGAAMALARLMLASA